MTFSKGHAPHNKLDIDPELIIQMYQQEQLTGEQIAKKLKVSPIVIYSRLRQLGITRNRSESLKGRGKGSKNGNWKGGCIGPQGYVVIGDGVGKTTRQHRVVAEQILGRPLKKGEVVHHKNGNKSDNSPENLEIFPSNSEHMKHHMTTEIAHKRGKMTKRSKTALLATLNG